MKKSSNSVRIGIAVAVIIGTVGWLAFSGYGSSKSYYVTIAELGGMGDKAYKANLRVEGFVKPGSIEQNGTHVSFVLDEFESHSPKAATGRILRVTYKGTEPPPDTLQGRCTGSRTRHIRPRRRLLRQRSAGQVRQQVRARRGSARYGPASGQARQHPSRHGIRRSARQPAVAN